MASLRGRANRTWAALSISIPCRDGACLVRRPTRSSFERSTIAVEVAHCTLQFVRDLSSPEWATLPRRKWPRLRSFDYGQEGFYFITVCAFRRRCLFGVAARGGVDLSAVGEMVARCWLAIPEHAPQAVLDAFVVMPNHIHGIVAIVGGSDGGMERAGKTAIPTIVGGFKAAVTKEVRAMEGFASTRLWQSRYYEHVIRSEASLRDIRQYIVDNPLKWDLDVENPERTA